MSRIHVPPQQMQQIANQQDDALAAHLKISGELYVKQLNNSNIGNKLEEELAANRAVNAASTLLQRFGVRIQLKAPAYEEPGEEPASRYVNPD